MIDTLGTSGLILNEPLLWEKEEKEGPVFPFPDVMWNPARWIRH